MRNILALSASLSVALLYSALQAGQLSSTEAGQKESSATKIELLQRDTPLKVGELAPNFRLQDQTKAYRTLDELLAKNEQVALVFYRSADW